MKKLCTLLLILIAVAGQFFFSCKEKTGTPEKIVAQLLVLQVDTFAIVCDTIKFQLSKNIVNEQYLQQLFLQARKAYKKIEWATEYFLPATARSINGPPVQEVEISGLVIEPAGLQVMEGLLFPNYDTGSKKQLLQQLDIIQRAATQYVTYFNNIDILDWQVWDAAKLEVFRIQTMGITGFDDPLTLQCLAESAETLSGLRGILSTYIPAANRNSLLQRLDSAAGYLYLHDDFNTFSRSEFITLFANPITESLTSVEKELSIHVIRYNRLLNQDAATLFDRDAYNVNAYAPDASEFMTDEKIALGKKLFSDPLLSQNNIRSCRSCHQPEKAFTDGLVKNTVIAGRTVLRRNTPTLINAALQPSQFYDGRVRTLEDQSHSVVQSEEEMHGSLEISVRRFWNDSTYRKLFAAAFPKRERTAIDTLEVMNALGSYIRSLTFLDSRFDEYMRGNKTAMTRAEINGFNLFMGKAKCATCHYMPLFNGTPPPRYMKMETEVIGVPAALSSVTIDPDSGRYAIIQKNSFLHAFKTPTLRNAAQTAPYMHNGVFITLEQVLDFYNSGGGAGMGIPIVNQTLPSDSLHLTKGEQRDIIGFIGNLDSRADGIIAPEQH
jgi:cytochrome c peroxidase